ncbi:MAG TPA: carboxypeptidase-like regulatory domain-containing protein, partial [Bryobacteraceae bacterium]|nr:carboxypeptidase-like regulatory domain-containing protein [Bryobacteraceae bacterium]
MILRKYKLTAAFALAILALIVPVASGQTAQITGMVRDASGTLIPGANVVLRNIATNIDVPTVTNEQGYYTVANLNPGMYDISVQKEGFRTITRTGVQLNVAQVARLDFDLAIGEVRESITVAAEVPILTTERATIGQVIGSKKILDLPLNGRDFTQLSTLVPGAISRGTESQTQAPLISVNGSRNSKTVFMIDGGSVTSQYFDSASVVPSVDAIQEFNVQSNSFSAEYGQGTAIINVSLRSGTNQVHGSAYEFLRNQVLDARNFFNTTG